MSLDKIELPAFIIQDLFQKNLTDIREYKKDIEEPGRLTFMGGNAAGITILVNNPGERFLTNKQQTFLTGILNACKLRSEDVAIVNLADLSLTYTEISEALTPKIILLFGVLPDAIQLPFMIPHFQKQLYNEQVYLSAPSLDEVENNKELKQKLWVSLKQLFFS